MIFLLVVVYNGPIRIEAGHSFSITCSAPRFSYLKWRLNGTDYLDDLESPNKSRPDRGPLVSTLNVQSAKPVHTGRYKCSNEFEDFGHNLTVILPGEEDYHFFRAIRIHPFTN